MPSLNARAWLALAALAVVMGLLLFVPAGTTHYWQAWVYLSIFFGASLLTTLYLMKNDPALLQRRMRGGPTAEKETTQKVIMFFASVGFIAMLGGVLPHFPRLSSEHLHIGDDRRFCESEGRFNGAVCDRASSDVRRRVTVLHWHAAGARLVLGPPRGRGHAAVPDMAARHEERLLARNLPGYTEYQKRVPDRLVPWIW